MLNIWFNRKAFKLFLSFRNMFLRNKIGAKAPSVQGLVVLIGALLVLYVLVMPPCEKCELLGGNCNEECESLIESQVLLKESPGEIGSDVDDVISHSLDSVDLFIQEGPEIITLANSLRVKNGLFGDLDQKLEFTINDLDNLDELFMSFAVIEAKGSLIVTLNGKQILNQEINEDRIETIELPKVYLEEDNSIKLQVDPPGLDFWSSHKYYLKDVKLKKQFELVHSSEVLEFSVSSSERNSIKDSELEFFVFCKGNLGENNILKIYLNNNLIFSKMVPCMSEEYSVDLDEDYYEAGVNDLKFSISDGDYLISDIEIRNEVEGEIYPSYVFYIMDEIYEDVDYYYLILDMSSGNKKADIIVNDKTLKLNTDNSFIEFDITNHIKRGNNFIEIRPTNDFRINELKVGY